MQSAMTSSIGSHTAEPSARRAVLEQHMGLISSSQFLQEAQSSSTLVFDTQTPMQVRNCDPNAPQNVSARICPNSSQNDESDFQIPALMLKASSTLIIQQPTPGQHSPHHPKHTKPQNKSNDSPFPHLHLKHPTLSLVLPRSPHGPHARAPGHDDGDVARDEERRVLGRALEEVVDHGLRCWMFSARGLVCMVRGCMGSVVYWGGIGCTCVYLTQVRSLEGGWMDWVSAR